MHWIPLSFFLPIGISLSARLFRSDGFMAFSLRTVPAICAFMGAILTFWLAILPHVANPPASPLLILIPPPAILAAGFAFHVSRSLKRGISAIRATLSFADGFAFSLAVTAAAIAANLAAYFNTWQSVEIPSSPKCFLEMRARVALCPEFDRRIAFESGKRVGIWIDTCGLDKFGAYKLANGAIYLESEIGFGNSYIIDSKNEKVYEARGGSAIELKGGMLCGRDGGGEAKFPMKHTAGKTENSTRHQFPPQNSWTAKNLSEGCRGAPSAPARNRNASPPRRCKHSSRLKFSPPQKSAGYFSGAEQSRQARQTAGHRNLIFVQTEAARQYCRAAIWANIFQST